MTTWIPLKIYKSLVDIKLDRLKDYLGVASQALDENLERTRVRAERTLAEMADDEAEPLDDFFIDEIHQAETELPILLFSSFIVMWYAFVDQELLKLCWNLAHWLKIEPYDKNRGIERVKKFLKDELGYEIGVQPWWNELTTIKKLRDTIVHRGTRLQHHRIKPDPQKGEEVIEFTDPATNLTTFYVLLTPLDQYLKQRKMLWNFGVFSDIAPTYDYCVHLFEFAREMFNNLFEDLQPLVAKLKADS